MKVNISEILEIGKFKLKQANIDISEARLLLAFVLNVEQHQLFSIDTCSQDEANTFAECINKRIGGVPYAYIVGKQEFMKLKFKVTSDVLIPRADTEVLVEYVIKLANENKKTTQNELKILDMCSGSGCIGISLAKYIANCSVVAVDISDKALKVAKENAKLNDVEIQAIRSDLFEKLDTNTKYDIIVSNPPYIRSDEILTLQQEVKNEPILALDGGEDGLDMYRKIIANAKTYLCTNGYLALEIGYDQASDVKKLLIDNMYKEIKVVKDLSNNDRVVVAKI